MYDLHTHSNFSDGTLPPEKLIEEAKRAGLTLIALTDHDTAGGVPRARRAARLFSLPFLCGIEMEAECEDQLHILGLGIDPAAEHINALVSLQEARRKERNERVLELLEDDGMDVRPFLPPTEGTVTRANIARAMFEAGFALSISDAFLSYLGRGQRYYVRQQHPEMPEVLEAIREAGGVSVLAHPMNMRVDHEKLISEMAANGLWGVEAYYGDAPRSTVDNFRMLARRYGLYTTCGSDFHGANRPGITLGCAWRDDAELNETERLLVQRFGLDREPERKPAPRINRRMSISEYQLLLERIAAELPSDFFTGLNGGIVISEQEKLHKKSLPGRPLYILGEYHYGGAEGRYITMYYGSFVKARGFLRGNAAREELKKVLLHEFRHHLETRAGEHDLEYEDDAYIAEYLDANEE